MEEQLQPRLGYAVVYVEDVQKSLEFYSKAFGFSVRRLDHAHMWGELESGETTLAFTPKEQHEADVSSHGPREASPRQNVELCLCFSDVERAYERAISMGAHGVARPEKKHWDQMVGYLRDPDGVIIRVASPVQTQSVS